MCPRFDADAINVPLQYAQQKDMAFKLGNCISSLSHGFGSGGDDAPGRGGDKGDGEDQKNPIGSDNEDPTGSDSEGEGFQLFIKKNGWSNHHSTCSGD
jgi:hypothetical protein